MWQNLHNLQFESLQRIDTIFPSNNECINFQGKILINFKFKNKNTKQNICDIASFSSKYACLDQLLHATTNCSFRVNQRMARQNVCRNIDIHELLISYFYTF
jgi:hypothetical protein